MAGDPELKRPCPKGRPTKRWSRRKRPAAHRWIVSWTLDDSTWETDAMKSRNLVVLVLVACLLDSASCGREKHSRVLGQFTSVDPATVLWRELPLPSKQSLYRKTLLADMQTGTGVDLLRYPAGVVTPIHTHTHGHGMYIVSTL
jgi:hypothetical protein